MAKIKHERQKRYDSKYAKRYGLKLTTNTDMDIIEVLEQQSSKQGFIKEAIRFYIAHGGGK